MAPIRVCVTGAAGQIAYSLIPMIAAGNMFGPSQEVILHLLDVDIEPCVKALNGMVMELEDCVYPLLKGVVATQKAEVAFRDVDYCVMCGAFPRKQGMERKDLLEKNAGIFKEQGTAIKKYGKPNCKCLVVGNPANTNALLLQHFGDLPPKNVTALTRLDMNRARNMIARRLGSGIQGEDVKNVIIWGNHSSTQYPDVSHAVVANAQGGYLPVRPLVKDDAWLNGEFIKAVQQRGAAVIAARGASSATSAARAIVDHMHDWHCGTKPGEVVSMGVWSTGNKYGVPDELIYSMPCVCKDGDYQVAEGLPIDDFSRGLMQKTAQELVEEKGVAMEATRGH